MRQLIVILMLLLPTITCAGQLYKWKDAAGKVHFSDRPPENIEQARDIKTRTTNESPADRQTRLYQEQLQTLELERVNAQRQNELMVKKQIKAINDVDEKYDALRQARLENEVKRYNNRIDIRDSKETRDYYREKRDFAKERLKIHRRYD